jgi:outer membrane protein assembly factor BamA
MSFFASLIPDKRIIIVLLLFSCFDLYPQGLDSTLSYRIESLSIKGNRKTKDRIITRELSKQLNDTIALSAVLKFKQRSEQNIFNTQLFIYDTIYTYFDHEHKTIQLKIVVKERWYVWPVPVFEIQDRNFNTWWQTKDLFRINYGFALGLENFTGVKDRLIFLFQRGYSERYGLSYRLPYLNKAQTVGFNMLYVFSRNNEVTYSTRNNIPVFVRQYKKYLRSDHEARAGISYRPNLYQQSTIEAVFNDAVIQDTVLQLNPEYFGKSTNRISYGSLLYRYTYDNRDNKIYPLKNWAFDLWLGQEGLDYASNAPVNNLFVAGSLRKHSKLFDRIYLANLAKGRLLNVDKLSFNFNRALGYHDFVRGYEYYVIEGQKYFLTKNCLRYQIVKPRVHQARKIIGVKEFNTIPYYAFLSLFFDAAYVEDKFYFKSNDLTNTWQYGYGLGLDLITYYDVVLRFEYSFNRLKESGFFIHMTSGF